MNNLSQSDIIWDDEVINPEDVTWEDEPTEVDPLAQAEYDSGQIPTIARFAQDIKKQSAQNETESWFAGGAKATAKQAATEFMQGVDTYLVPIAKGQFDIPKAVVDTAAGASHGILKFITYPLALAREVFNQAAGGGIKGIDIADAKKVAELETAIFNFEPTDPLATTALATIGAVPLGVKTAYDVVKDELVSPAAKELITGVGEFLDQHGIKSDNVTSQDVYAAFNHALDVGGWGIEVTSYGKVIGAIAKPGKAKPRIPTEAELAKAKMKEAAELVGETKGIGRLGIIERGRVKRAERGREDVLAVREREQQLSIEKRAEEKIPEPKKKPRYVAPKKEIPKIPMGEERYQTKIPTKKAQEPWEMTKEEIEVKFPQAHKIVDGRTVRAEIPNQSSIEASIETPTILKGIREVSMSEFDAPPVINAKTKALAKAIQESGEINPLIVAIDKEGAYILEGANRYDALKILKAKSIPAQVVLDEGSLYGAVEQALSGGMAIPKRILAEYPELSTGKQAAKSVVSVGKTETKLAEEFNKKYPGHDLIVSEPQTFPAYGDIPAKSFTWYTPDSGPTKGNSFIAKGGGIEGVKAGFKDMTERFGLSKSITLDNLGLQKGYERLGGIVKAMFQGGGEKVRKRVERYRAEALEVVKGNPLDRAAIPFVKSGKFKDYLDNMSELGDITFKELLQKDPDTGKLIATIKDSAGKEKPAVRKSGFHTLKEFQDAIQGYKDIGKLSYEWTDPLRLMQEMDQGKIAGPVQKQIMWPIHATTEARYLWMDQWKAKAAGVVDNFKIRSSKKAKAVGDVIEAVKDWNDTNENILKIPDVASALRKIGGKNRLDIIEATRQIAKLLEGMRSDINAARKIRGQKEIGEIKGYRPHVREANIWSRWGLEDLKPAEIMDTPGLPDFVRPNQVWFKHALTRKGLLKKYALERNMVKLLGDYIESAGKDIFNTNIIQHMKIHAAVMRDAKMPHAAYAIDRLAAEAFAGTSHWITRGARRVVPEGVLRTISGIRRNLTRAVFPLNFGWNLFVQTTSGALTVARYGATNSLKGLQYFTSRSMNQAVKQNAYSHLTKTRWGGNIIYQDMARSIARTRRLHASKMDRVDQFLDFFTSTIESALTGHAIVSAYHHGKGLGLKGRALWEYASEGGAKTQSMYNHADVPGLLKSRLVGSIVPFQTFAFEIMNTVRELNVIGVRRVVGKTGLYETMSANSATGRALISKRLGMIGRWTAAIIVTNAVADAAIHRKPWKLSSFIPFLGYILNGSPMAPVVGERGQLSVPSSYVGDFYAGVKAVLEYEDWRKLRRWALRYHARAGIQLERVIEGIEVNAENGWVTDVSGKKLFQVPKEEREKMLFTGPWATSAGQEHLTGKGKKKETRTLRTLEK